MASWSMGTTINAIVRTKEGPDNVVGGDIDAKTTSSVMGALPLFNLQVAGET